jgi:TP901 family phage tail tape measure protein
MPKSMRVKTQFEATDDISKTTRRIEKNLDRMNRKIQRGFRQNTRAAKSFGSTMKGFLAAGVIERGFGRLAQGARETAFQYADFDDAMTGAAARFKDIGVGAKDFDKRLKSLKKSTREFALETKFTAVEAANAMNFFSKADFTEKEALGSLRSVMDLASATGEDFAQITDWSTDLLGAFGLAVDDSAKKIKNFKRMNDALGLTAIRANVTVENLFDTFKDVGPVATQLLDETPESLLAIARSLASSGIKSTKAMTGMRGLMLSLVDTTSEGAQVFKTLKISMSDPKTGDLRKVKSIMDELVEKTKHLGKEDLSEVMAAIFGKIPLASVAIFMKKLGEIGTFEKTLDNAGGTVKRVATVINTSLGNQVKILGSAFLEFGFKFMDPWEKDMKGAISRVAESMRELDPSVISKGLRDVVTKSEDVAKDVIRSPFKLRDVIREFLGIDRASTKESPVFGEEKLDPEELRKWQREKLQSDVNKAIESLNPTFNIDVNQNISSENIKVENEIKAPGGSGKVMRNKF